MLQLPNLVRCLPALGQRDVPCDHVRAESAQRIRRPVVALLAQRAAREVTAARPVALHHRRDRLEHRQPAANRRTEVRDLSRPSARPIDRLEEDLPAHQQIRPGELHRRVKVAARDRGGKGRDRPRDRGFASRVVERRDLGCEESQSLARFVRGDPLVQRQSDLASLLEPPSSAYVHLGRVARRTPDQLSTQAVLAPGCGSRTSRSSRAGSRTGPGTRPPLAAHGHRLHRTGTSRGSG